MAVLRCTDPFAYTEKNGVQRVLRAGDLVESNDPCVKGRESMFEPAEANAHQATNRAVEQATAVPGEARAVKRATKKAPQ